MPSTPLFIHHLADAIPAIEALETDLIDRRTLEEALGVSKWTAWRLMRSCGACDGPGGALVCRRSELIAALRKLEQDGHLAPEIARRQRVARYLDQIGRYASSKHMEVARDQAANDLLATRFSSLPPASTSPLANSVSPSPAPRTSCASSAPSSTPWGMI